ncbi:DUF4031 domain-containing protein, partial [Nocardiopsis coralliicola]
MSVLIDPPAWPGPRGLLYCHLVSDRDTAELHAFAERLGLPRRAFDRDHYDVPEHLHARAVELGAAALPARELVARLNASGLRRRKRWSGAAAPRIQGAAAPPASAARGEGG